MIIIRLTVERTAEDQGAPYAVSFEEYKADVIDDVPMNELDEICAVVTGIIRGQDG